MSKTKESDIAIVGIACHFPGAEDYKQYWQNLLAKKKSIKEIPIERWDVSKYYSAQRGNDDKSISKWCGLIDDIKSFDNEFFNISPIEAKNMDPQQRLLLQQSWRCIEDSAIPLSSLQKSKTSVFVGAMTSDYLQTLNKNQDANNRYSILGNDHCILANRISHQLNLSGESISINAASASSLVAIHKAKSALVLGECEFAIAAGVNLNTDPFKYIVFSKAGMLSPDGECKSFSDDANGYVPGDGVAVLLLQPLSKAIKDNNHIYAVIKGSAINHIGSGKAITAPCVDAQAGVISEALKNAQRDIADVGYIEAHGSGTPLGDPIEIEAISRVFKEAESEVVIGTVKPNIGHLEAAAGIAGVIKALQVLKHQYIPANLNLNKVNPVINLSDSPLKLATGEELNTSTKPCVGVSSFGFGGVSCHLILEKYQNGQTDAKQNPNKILPAHFILSAKSQASLEQNIRQWSQFLNTPQYSDINFKDICSSVTTGREQFPFRTGFVVANKDDLLTKLKQQTVSNKESLKQQFSFVFADVSACTLNSNQQLIKSNYEALLKKVEASSSYNTEEAASLFRNNTFHSTLISVAIFISLRQLEIFPALIESTPKGVWAALLCSEIVKLEDYLDVMLQHKKIPEIIFYRPKFPFRFSNDANIISPKYINKQFIHNFFQEINNNYEAYKNIIKQAGALLNSSEVFKSILSEWNIDNDLFTTIRDFSHVFSADINRAAYAVVAANVSLNHFYKKWMFECRTNQHSYYITAFSALVCHEMLSKSDFYKISTKQHPDIDKCLSDLNNQYWDEINQVLCDKQRFEHRKAIIEKKQFIAAIVNKDTSICNSQMNSQTHILRISLGSIEPNYSHLVKHEISSVDQWQQTLLAVWLNGHDLCWNELYPPAQFKRLPLPGYSFKKVHFWASKIEQNNDCSQTQNTGIKAATIDSKPIENITTAKIHKVSRQVKSILSTLLDLEEEQLDTQKSFDAYGFDSMAYTLLCEKINSTHNVALTPACFYGFKNVQKLIECIEQQLSENTCDTELSDQQQLSNASIPQQENNNDVAIIGYSGTLPKAETLEQFWNNLIKGVDGISEIPKLRWDWRDYYSTDLGDKNKSPSKWGGFMPNIGSFDAAFFGISPQEAKLMDPQQRILLQTVWHAIEHSGHKPASLSGTDTGVFIGASTSDYEELIRKYELAAHASTGMNRSIIANRISFLLDLHGPSEVIDTACSSSLVAIHKAIEAIKMGHCHCAIAGGVNALITPTHYISYGKAGMLSPDGHCKTFDKDANGYVRAEGVGVIILKSLSQALADNDSIHAVIKASGINHGGRSNSLTAPNPNAQAQLIFDTYKKAGIDSHSIDYIENHGTGTPLGDPIEINGLTKAFTDLDNFNKIESQQQTEHKCYLASVKSNIGHLEAAAGVAGILKLVLALKNEILPAGLNFQELNPYIKLDENRFEILQKNRPWPKNNKHKLRRAGISSFGFGGVNAHVVLEEYINNHSVAETDDECLLILSAKNAQALEQYAQNYLRYLSTEKFNIPLQNIAYTSQLGRNDEKFRLAICTSSIKGLIAELNSFIKKADSKNYTFNVVEQENVEKANEENSTARELQKLWTQGLKIDWDKFYENKDIQFHGLQRVALPTYPFQKKHFWLSADKKQQLPISPAKTSMRKKAQTNIQTSSNNNFSKIIANDSFIAKQHIVNGQAISPGVYSLDLIYSALVASGSKIKNMVLLDVFFRESILFAGNNVAISINNKPHKKGRLLEIHTNTNKNIATQAIVVKDENPVFNKEFASLEHYRAIDINSLYSKLKASGFDYGANFRVIKSILHHDGQYIAQLTINTELDADDFILDPRLLDGALQTCLACLLHNNINESYIPMMIEKVVAAGKLPDTVFAYVTPKQALNNKQSTQDSYAFDIQIVDEHSQPYVELSTVVFKKTPQTNKVSKNINKPDTTINSNNAHKLKPALLMTKKSSRVQTAVALTDNENKTPSPDNNTENTNTMENQQVSTKILLNKTIEYFLSIIANTASLEKNEIDVKQSFKEYGIDSFLTLSIIRNLEDDFGDLRKTLLFEASNILELADIFIEEQQATLMKLLDIKPQKIEQQQPEVKQASLANAFAQKTPAQTQQPEQVVKPSNNNQYQVISDHLLDQDSVLSAIVVNLFSKYGGETVALSRKDIAPNIFIPSKQQGVFYFNTHKNILLAFRYVGPADYFAEALLELENYCISNELQVNVLCEMPLDHMQQNNFSANAFGVVQRIPNLSKFTINGSKMRRLRYQVNKFQQAGSGQTTEYNHGSDGATDAAIASMIEKWANNKSGVNPYIWRVKDEMETGCLGSEYRIFLTHLDNNLQNVIIISRIESENSYLLDTEFYSNDMATGAMEFAICEIIQLLKAEACAGFSLGLTFGSRFNDAPDCDPAVAKAFVRLAEDKIFEEAGNHQFKNKYRCKNSPLYLYRPIGQPASNVLDIIMMIGNPHSLKNQSAKTQKSQVTSHVTTTQTKREFQAKSQVKSQIKPQVKQHKKININNESLLKKAGYNPFNLARNNIEYDLATDSWSELEYDFIKTRTQALQLMSKNNDQQLETILSEMFALPYVIAFASGRVAESFFCPAWPKQKKYVLQNVLFPTCLYHQINNDFFPIEVTNSEFYNRTSNHLFKGNIDCNLLKVQLKEYHDDISFVWVELANNAAGGCPVSLANLKEIKACIGDIPLVLDATRIIENAYHIAEYEEQYLGQDIWDIVKEICSYADVLNASLTKDFGTHTGGFIATRDENLYAKMQDAVSTNGSGLSRTDHYLVCNALNDKDYISSMVKQRMDWVLLLAQTLIDHDITVIQPVGGHCVLIDPMSSIDGLAELDLPLPSFLSWLYKNTGIRAGIHSVGRQRNTSMNNLIRLAIPVGVSRVQIDEIAKRLIALFNTDTAIDNLALKDKPDGLFGEVKANYLSTSQVKLNLAPKEIEQPENTVEDIAVNTSAQNATNNEKTLQTAGMGISEITETTKIAGIAVIGMSGRYPDADNLQQFWENLSDGKNSIKMGPDWQSRFIDKNTQQHLGGFIDDVDKFDSLFFSISPREAQNMDPQERLMLEVCWQALEDAGYHPESLCANMTSNDVGVFVGAVWSYYEMLGSENRQFGGGSIANSQHWGISNRVSSFMNFSGPSLTVDTACSSSLTAIHLACESLRNGECKVALAGGINLDLHPSKYHITKAAQFLSDDGQCRAFGKGGSGYVAGEGVGTLLLKPVDAAIADGDHIYGVIKSTAINHGGRTAGYTVPSPNAQADLISSAIKKANISAESISYLEAHGTGTELGDPVEIQGTSKAYRKDTDKKQYCSVGSVKTNIGHLEAAAGIAGATKLLLQMQHKQLLPSLHSTELNEYIDFNNSPFYVQQHKEFWQPLQLNGQQVPRRAGLSSFGAGGTNVHIIFEEYEQAINTTSNNQEQLIILSARKDEGLKSQAHNLLAYLQKSASADINLNNLAHTLQIGRLAMSKRLAIVADNLPGLINSLEHFINGKDDAHLYVTEAATKLALDLFDGDESEQIIQVLVNNGSYSKIAKLWANGVDINWKIAAKNNNAQKISLPTYPFAKVSHWMEASTATVLQTVTNNSLKNSYSVTSIHPLLDQNCSTFAKQEFSKQFNLEQYIFSDHIVDKLPTLPGVAYMEMARAAAEQASGFKVTTLRNMVWASPINSLGSHDIRISLQHKKGEAHFEICTFEASGKKNIHSQGKALCTAQASIPVLRKDLNAIKNRCNGFMTKKECYDLLGTRKLTYGDKLQAITGFHYGQKEGLTSLELPAGLADSFNDYDAHPSILDGAVQSIISLLEYANTLTQAGVPYVPFVMSELNILKPLTHKGYAHLTLDEGKKQRDDIKKINIDILDESGQVLVQMKDFSFKAISEEIASNVTSIKSQKHKLLSQNNVVLYQPVWKSSATNTSDHMGSLENTVVLFDHNQQNKQVLQKVIATSSNPALVLVILAEPADSFTKIDKQHYQLNPGNTEHIQQLIDAIRADGLTPNNFIHNLSTNPYLAEKAAIENDLNNGLLAVFSLSQTLLKNRKAIGSKSLNLTYIYHTDGDNAQPVYNAVNGFMRSIKQEGANINCKTICLNNPASGQNINIDWAAILLEQNNNDLEVAIKGKQRYIKTLNPIEVQSTSSDRAVALSKANGVYLITGGAGGLGIIFAQELAKAKAVKLILTGRSSVNEGISSKIRELQKIVASVEYISCDLTIANDVKSLVNGITEKHGRLDGLIHAAGIIKDGFLWNKERAAFSQVLAPKVLGTQNLDSATSHINLDYFMMCSSIAATNGNMGQSDYAAGNRFMDDFAQLRQQWCKQGSRKGKTLSINWPLWRSGGMQVNQQAEKWLFDNWGMKPLTTNIGLEALHYGLAQPAPSFGVVEGDVERICTALSIEQKGHKTIAPVTTAKVEAVTTNLNIKQPQLSVIATTPSNNDNNDPIIDKVKTDLSQMVIELLKINESDIDFAENMSTYGFDSVTFTEFANLINSQLEIEVTPLIFFEQETLDELTEYLLEDFVEPLEQHYASDESDEEQAEQTENFINASYESEQQNAEQSSEETIEKNAAETPVVHNLFEEYIEESSTGVQDHNNNEPIAIIGIDGVMPQSENADVFWNNLVNEKNLITEIPKDRWDWKKFYGESDLGNSKTEIKWGGFMPEVDKFDAEFFNISPLEAELTDPQQRLFLQSVWHTIEDSGYKASDLSGTNTGVFVGIGSSDYHELLREQSSDFEAYSVAGWMHAVLANRISYFFNWSGASEPIGTACSKQSNILPRQ